MMFMMPMPPTTSETAATPASKKPIAREVEVTACISSNWLRTVKSCSLLLCRASSTSVISCCTWLMTSSFSACTKMEFKNVRVVMRCMWLEYGTITTSS